jgi:hypothetical protein
VTVGPLSPGFYTYGYAIDGGLRMPDPYNPNLDLRRWGVCSSFPVSTRRRSMSAACRTARFTLSSAIPKSRYLTNDPGLYAAGLRTRQTENPVLHLLHGNREIEAS